MKAIVALSGGMDSLVTFAIARDECDEVQPVNFFYGSKHGIYEQESARKIAKFYDKRLIEFDLSEVFKISDSALMLSQEEVPEGHYELETMRRTVVPGRNSIFATIMLGLAQSMGYDTVYMGIHRGDHYIYPDCRPDWLRAMWLVYKAASEGTVEIIAPLIHSDKANIVAEGHQRYVPFDLTRTCYKPQVLACGKCGSCNERLEAFAKAGVPDPIKYEGR